MIGRFEARAACIGWAERRARGVVVCTLVLTAVLGGYAVARLGVDSDPIRLISERLPFRQRHDRFAALFPNLTNALLIVVEGQSPAQARTAAEKLAARLAPQRERFRDVYVPGSGAFFERNGLHRSAEDLDALGDQIARMQPFLLAIEREPTLANLAMVRAGLERIPAEKIDAAGWSAVLDRFSDAAVAVHTEFRCRSRGRSYCCAARPSRWVRARRSSPSPCSTSARSCRREPRCAPCATPRPTSPSQASRAPHRESRPERRRDAVAGLGRGLVQPALVRRGGHAGLAGAPLGAPRPRLARHARRRARVDRRLRGARRGPPEPGLHHLRGALHRPRHRLRHPPRHALRRAPTRRDGDPPRAVRAHDDDRLLRVPADGLPGRGRARAHRGYGNGGDPPAELHAAPGAALVLARAAAPREPPRRAAAPGGLVARLRAAPEGRAPGGPGGGFRRRGAAPGLRFEPDVVDLRNPKTESVQAFQDLVAAGGLASPWFADVLAPDLGPAREIAERLRATRGVGRVVTLSDFVPEDQEEKRQILAALALLIDPAAFAIGASDPPPVLSPAEQLRDHGALERFTDAVLGVAPEATGMAVDVVEFGRVVSRSLVQALGSALLAIALVVFPLWRRLDDTLLALAPLLLASLLTGAWMALFDVSFNFANVIVLPLLLGVGVDSGIHLVHRARHGGAEAGSSLLATTTARAVFYSFATTVVSFGRALSGHRGIASMGFLLVVGMAISLACNLVVLPALIEWRMGARSR